MKHSIGFERFDFTKRPSERQEVYVEFEFPKVDDENIQEFEELMWKSLFSLPDTGVTGHFSSWFMIRG